MIIEDIIISYLMWPGKLTVPVMCDHQLNTNPLPQLHNIHIRVPTIPQLE